MTTERITDAELAELWILYGHSGKAQRLLDEIERLHALFEVVGNAIVQSGIAESESLPAKAAEFLEEARKALGSYGPKDGKFSALAKRIRGQTWNSELIHERDCEIERLRAELASLIAVAKNVAAAATWLTPEHAAIKDWPAVVGNLWTTACSLRAELEKKP